MGLTILGLDHVQLAAPNGCEDEARNFFGAVLGMHEIEKPEALRERGGVWFQAGSQQLHIGVEADFTPAKKAHPAFYVNDLDKLIKRLDSEGIPSTHDFSIPGTRRTFVHDPFGNRLEFLER